MPGTVDAVLDIDDAPFAAKPVAIGATVPSAPAVIHIQNGKPTAGPVLDIPVEGGREGARRPAMGADNQWRQLVCRSREITIDRRVEETEGGLPVLGRKLD